MVIQRKKRILFVCCGNRERSIIAERLLLQRLRNNLAKAEEKVEVSSAGIVPKEYLRKAKANGIEFDYPLFGKNPNIYAIEYLARKGIDVSSYRSRELTDDMVAEADLILAIDSLIKSEVLYLYPEVEGKLFTFKEFVFGVGRDDLDIGDPLKLPHIDRDTGTWVWPESYADSYIAEIEECVSAGIDKFVRYITNSEITKGQQ